MWLVDRVGKGEPMYSEGEKGRITGTGDTGNTSANC